MKKIIAYSAALGLAMSASLALPTAASAEKGGQSEAAAACQLVAAETDLSVGTCMNLSSENGNPAPICMLLKDLGLLEVLGFKNQGQCMQALRL
jgi:hypothetical protein